MKKEAAKVKEEAYAKLTKVSEGLLSGEHHLAMTPRPPLVDDQNHRLYVAGMRSYPFSPEEVDDILSKAKPLLLINGASPRPGDTPPYDVRICSDWAWEPAFDNEKKEIGVGWPTVALQMGKESTQHVLIGPDNKANLGLGLINKAAAERYEGAMPPSSFRYFYRPQVEEAFPPPLVDGKPCNEYLLGPATASFCNAALFIVGDAKNAPFTNGKKGDEENPLRPKTALVEIEAILSRAKSTPGSKVTKLFLDNGTLLLAVHNPDGVTKAYQPARNVSAESVFDAWREVIRGA